MAQRKISPFDEEKIQRLFGHEAAEDEDPQRLQEYYFKPSTYDQVVTELPLRIVVGHKGIGKSALFQVALAENREMNLLAISVKPDDVLDIATESNDFLKSVRNWKVGIREIIEREASRRLDVDISSTSGSDLLLMRLAKELGAQGCVDELGAEFLRSPQIIVYIDDLDRGWQGSTKDVRRISALLSAVRDLSNEDRGIKFRISLRSDVYFLVRTSDESTDKVEGSVVWNSWTNNEIFALLVKRIETFYGRDVDYDDLSSRSSASLAHYLDPVFEPRFQGRGHWRNAPIYRVMMSLVRKRPRDLVKLCTLAARSANRTKHNLILTGDLEASFEEYSQGRVQDAINEYNSELRDIERLLFGMRPSKKEASAKAGYVYPTESLIRKIKNIQEQGKFYFASGREASPQELAAFMYKINFITARKESGGLIHRKYFEEQRYLQSKFADFGYDWEVHPAYRWALQPSDVRSVFDSLELSADD
ncbi:MULTISPECIES: P-loop ATPase, Sll1717 family [unclassified Rhodococcus (in: high G+C Gram-positive bacteria)]|uniref:P-loop ATPase, Sll1717 family n=1 Tax=unclassified Rhodococcus (in: high G+C Gram-positive bacteria) TaxID=192944 RepID=UPI0009326A63|nr:hypothetical protein [Rhodococcus sp. M8]OLL18352.1 hypothetical protein BKE56_017675 [Rhodococcus sp. M8]QPG45410.1 hypothetical protein ISO16_27015 [Rhodococcus sp. M8]